MEIQRFPVSCGESFRAASNYPPPIRRCSLGHSIWRDKDQDHHWEKESQPIPVLEDDQDSIPSSSSYSVPQSFISSGITFSSEMEYPRSALEDASPSESPSSGFPHYAVMQHLAAAQQRQQQQYRSETMVTDDMLPFIPQPPSIDLSSLHQELQPQPAQHSRPTSPFPGYPITVQYPLKGNVRVGPPQPHPIPFQHAPESACNSWVLESPECPETEQEAISPRGVFSMDMELDEQVPPQTAEEAMNKKRKRDGVPAECSTEMMMGDAVALEDRKSKRKRKTPRQLAILESEFGKNQMPNKEMRERLGQSLGLTSRQVQIWFQNKRAKVKNNERKKGGVPAGGAQLIVGK